MLRLGTRLLTSVAALVVERVALYPLVSQKSVQSNVSLVALHKQTPASSSVAVASLHRSTSLHLSEASTDTREPSAS